MKCLDVSMFECVNVRIMKMFECIRFFNDERKMECMNCLNAKIFYQLRCLNAWVYVGMFGNFMFECLSVQLFKCVNVWLFECSNVRMLHCLNVSKFECLKCSNVLHISCLNVRIFVWKGWMHEMFECLNLSLKRLNVWNVWMLEHRKYFNVWMLKCIHILCHKCLTVANIWMIECFNIF